MEIERLARYRESASFEYEQVKRPGRRLGEERRRSFEPDERPGRALGRDGELRTYQKSSFSVESRVELLKQENEQGLSLLELEGSSRLSLSTKSKEFEDGSKSSERTELLAELGFEVRLEETEDGFDFEIGVEFNLSLDSSSVKKTAERAVEEDFSYEFEFAFEVNGQIPVSEETDPLAVIIERITSLLAKLTEQRDDLSELYNTPLE